MVVTAAELEPPRPISNEDFDDICFTFQIPEAQQGDFQMGLIFFQQIFAEIIREERLLLDHNAGRENLRDALKSVRKARKALAAPFGITVAPVLHRAAQTLEPMVMTAWLREQLSDVHVPGSLQLIRGTGEERERSLRDAAAKRLLDDAPSSVRLQFCHKAGAALFVKVLDLLARTLEASLAELKRRPHSKGGQQPLTYRQCLIEELADCWRSFGKIPTVGPKSEFTSFCEAVFVSIGWPTSGIDTAVADALRMWRNRGQKSSGDATSG